MRQVNSKNKICRRYGINFFNRKISTTKLKTLPGNPRRAGKASSYKLQLEEKQKLYYYYYGITNNQMSKYHAVAIKTINPIKTFKKLIDKRLHCFIVNQNNSMCSQFNINQQIRHGNVMVNDVKMVYKSHHLRKGDVVTFKGEKLIYNEEYQHKNEIPYKPNYQVALDYFKR